MAFNLLDNNLLIWHPHRTAPDPYRQITRTKNKNTKNMRIATFPSNLEFIFNNSLQNEDKSKNLNNFFVDIDRLKKHLFEISQELPAQIFYGKVHNKVYESQILKKSSKFFYGSITLGLRAEYRNERVLNFGKKTGIRHKNKSTIEEQNFEDLIFLGLFGGTFEGKPKKENINFVDVIINLESKEIYHIIDYNKLLKFKKILNLDYEFLNPMKINKDNFKVGQDESWDTDISNYVPKYRNNISIERPLLLSEEHKVIQFKLANYFIGQKYQVKKERFNLIDLYVENEKKAYIFEIKTSDKELYKAVGQILVYYEFIKMQKSYKIPLKKVILFNKKYFFKNNVLKAIQKLGIEIKSIEDYKL